MNPVFSAERKTIILYTKTRGIVFSLVKKALNNQSNINKIPLIRNFYDDAMQVISS